MYYIIVTSHVRMWHCLWCCTWDKLTFIFILVKSLIMEYQETFLPWFTQTKHIYFLDLLSFYQSDYKYCLIHSYWNDLHCWRRTGAFLYMRRTTTGIFRFWKINSKLAEKIQHWVHALRWCCISIGSDPLFVPDEPVNLIILMGWCCIWAIMT